MIFRSLLILYNLLEFCGGCVETAEHKSHLWAAWKGLWTARRWRGRAYLISPLADFMLAGGLSLIVFFLLFIFYRPQDETYAMRYAVTASLMSFLAFFINDPHFISSYLLLYRNYRQRLEHVRGHRELYARYLIAGVAVPFLLACLMLWALIGNHPALISYAILSMFFFVGWHYAKQAFGVFMILSGIKGIYYGRWQRRILLFNAYFVWAFYWLVASITIPGVETGAETVWGVEYITYHFLTIPDQTKPLISGVVLFFLAVSVIIIVWEKTSPRPSVSGLTGYLSMYYFILFSGFHPMWVLIYPFFHSLQYLMFVYAYKRGEFGIRTTGVATPEDIGKAGQELWLFTGLALLGGILLFAALPTTLEYLSQQALGRFVPFTAAIIVFINIHHYFIDNVLWRKENAEVRRYFSYEKDRS